MNTTCNQSPEYKKKTWEILIKLILKQVVEIRCEDVNLVKRAGVFSQCETFGFRKSGAFLDQLRFYERK
jgi:hypothetical protein